MTRRLQVALSTCPNDTFAFHALLERRIAPVGFELELHLTDVEDANRRFAAGEFDAAKVSFAAALAFDDARILPVGAALGFGVGPLVLAARPGVGLGHAARILLPGEHTTASLLFELFHPGLGRREQRVFSEITPALSRGEADFGVCIHEARFTYRDQGLTLVEDLGERWERETGQPLPLGGIAARATLEPEILRELERVLRASIAYGFAHRDEARTTMGRFAQELDPRTLDLHVDTYVSADTLELSEAGEEALAELARRASAIDPRHVLRRLCVARAEPVDGARLFRALRPDEAAALARGDGTRLGELSLAGAEFVHLSTAEQLAQTLSVHFRHDVEALTLVELDRVRARAAGRLRWEPARAGALFPHLHRPLEADDILGAWRVERVGATWRMPRLAGRAEADLPRRTPRPRPAQVAPTCA